MQKPNLSVVQSAPLTDWPAEPTVMALKEDLQLSKPTHDAQVSKVKRWLDLRDVTGSAKPKKQANRSSVQPKLVRRNAEWRYSALSEPFLSAEYMFDVSPTSWEDVEGARQNKLMLDYQMRTKLRRVKFIDEYVRTTVDEGTCYVKPGWNRETVMETVEVPIYTFLAVETAEEMQILEQAMQLHDENPQDFKKLDPALQAAVDYTMETTIPVIAQQSGVDEIEQEKIIKNHPTLDIVPFENVYLDPGCEGDLGKANYAIISFETNKARLLKDGRYKNLDKVNWAHNTPLTDDAHSTTMDSSVQHSDDLRRPVVAYEYWGFYDVNGDDTLVPVVATWIGDVMIRMEENPYPDQEIPLILVPYLPVKRSVTGEPDAELLEDNQAIMGAVTRGMVDLLGRSANGQTGVAKGMLDTVNRRRYDRGDDYEFNPSMMPAAGFHQHKYPELPASAMNMLSLQNQEAEAISGVKSFAGGLSGEAYGDVASGIRGMLDAAAKREMSILRRLAEGVELIGRKMISMNQAFLSEEEVVQVTNDEFVTVTRAEIQGEYNIKVDIETAEIEEAKAQDLGFLLQTMGNTLPFEMTQRIMTEIARLKRMPLLTKMMEEYEPKPDPLAQRKAELELDELEAKIDKMRADAELTRAKARGEVSSADKTDLDFVEQETGTAHARSMQQTAAQAEANKELEISKAILSSPDKRPSNENILTAMGVQDAQRAR